MKEKRLLYDSFNARYLDFNEVAELFIPNLQYESLVKANHSLLMGPRGSGKTTLLKMLTVPAQHVSRQTEEGINNLPFYGIYIPTDIHWKKQIDNFEKEFKSYPDYQKVITRLIVTTNILISLCDTFIQLLEFKDSEKEDASKEAALAIQLIDDWKIRKPIAANLTAVRHSLLSRLGEINSHKKRVKLHKPIESEIDYPDYFYDEFIDLVTLGCDAFESIFKNDPFFATRNFKWALCFDELEIAPRWLQIELLSILRSLQNQKLLFKLTMVPLVVLNDSGSAQIEIVARETQDYEVIRTWTYSQQSLKTWQLFAKKLIEDKLRRKFQNTIQAISLFGGDDLSINIKETFKGEDGFEGKAGYAEDSDIFFLFKEYAKVDSSFRAFLKSKQISSTTPVPNTKAETDSIFRKIKPIVVHRFQYRNIGRLRGRKNPALYYGLPNMYDMCDGNPRALIGLIDEFFTKLRFESTGNPRKFPIHVQSRLIVDVAERYLNLLLNHPDSNIGYHNKYINLGQLLDKIGNYFKDRVINDDFKMDPVNCFVIDQATPIEIIELLKVAMHLGAIIYLDPKESVSKGGMVGKKFRLSYLLFPNYKLPTVVYNEINLSQILRKGTDKIDQLLLFDAI